MRFLKWRRQYRRTLNQGFFIALIITFIANAGLGQSRYLVLGDWLNARTDDRDFRKGYRDNVLFALEPQTIGKIIAVNTSLRTKNLAYQIEITSGNHRGKTVWVYDDIKEHPERMMMCKDPECRQQTPERDASNQALRTQASVDAHRTDPINPKHVAKGRVEISPTGAGAVASAQVRGEQTIDSGVQEGIDCKDCRDLPIPPKPTAPSLAAIEPLRGPMAKTYENSSLIGAYKIMATNYQSCSVLNKNPYDWSSHMNEGAFKGYVDHLGHSEVGIRSGATSQVVSSHYYLKDLEPARGEKCEDVRKKPPLYNYAGGADREKLSQGKIDILSQNHGGRGFAPSRGINCSSFESLSYLASGRKLTADGTTYLTSNDFLKQGNGGKNDCFERPKFTANQSIQSGDTLSLGGHVVKIDNITDSNDPFGVERWKSPGQSKLAEADCYKTLDRQQLRFNLIMSTGTGMSYGDNLGISRTTAKAFFAGNYLWLGYVQAMARQACLAKVNGSANSQPANHSRWALLRHLGDSKQACMGPPMEIEGYQCVAGCFKNDQLPKGY